MPVVGLEDDVSRLRSQQAVQRAETERNQTAAAANYAALYDEASSAFAERGLTPTPVDRHETTPGKTWYGSPRVRTRKVRIADRVWSVPTDEIVGERGERYVMQLSENGVIEGPPATRVPRVPIYQNELARVRARVIRYLAILDERDNPA